MLGNFVSRLKRCSYRQLYNPHTACQFRVQNASGKFVFTALTAFRLLWRAKGKRGLFRQMSKDTSKHPSCLKIQPKAGMGHVNTSKDLKTTAKLSQVQSTNSLKNTNSKFYSLIENLIQIPAKSYRVQPLSSSNTLEGFPTQELCKGSRSKWRQLQTQAAHVTTPRQGLSGEAISVSHF